MTVSGKLIMNIGEYMVIDYKLGKLKFRTCWYAVFIYEIKRSYYLKSMGDRV